MNITIDARGCGQGKTRDPLNGIYARIKQAHINNIGTVIAVPSIELQDEYIENLTGYNIKVINSTTSDNVAASINNAMRSTNIILITHKALIQSFPSMNRSRYQLIIDEALDGLVEKRQIKSVKPDVLEILRLDDVRWHVEVDGENLSTLPTDKLDNKAYYAFDWDPSVNDGILWSDSRQWRQITDVCWTNWVTQQGWYDLCDGVSTTIIQSRKRGILANWNNIHIAAAKFENTQMCHWMRSLDVKWEVVNEFVAHTIKANITSPANVMLTKKKNDIDTYSDWRWSKNQFQNKPEILEKYHNFIDSSKLTEWIAIRNNTDADRKVDRPASRHQREVRVSHYVSGMNKYRHISAISLETSTRPSRDMNDWFKQVYEVTDTQIQQMTEGYRNYQVVMRTKVRDDSNAIIDIWAIDNAFIWMLNDYIDFDIKYTPKHLTQIDLIDIGQISRGGRPSKYLSDEERREAKKKADRLRIAELRAKNKKCKK